jgi:hypothetical protein
MGERHVRATLEVDLDDRGSIAGSIRGEGSEPVSFSSWLGLAGAITGLADSGAAGPARRVEDTTPDLLANDPEQSRRMGS